MKKLIYGSLVLAIAGMSLSSCKKSVTNPPLQNTAAMQNSSSARTGAPVILTGDVLDFKTQEDFDNTIRNMESSGVDYTMTGFTSLYTTFFKVIAAEEEAMTMFRNGFSSDDDAIAHQSEFRHSSEYDNNQDILVHAVFDTDNEPYLDMNIYSVSIAKLVNKYGFVIIEDKLFRFTKTSIAYSTVFNASVSAFDLTNTPNGGALDIKEDVTVPGVEKSCVCAGNLSYSSTVDYNGSFPKYRNKLAVVLTHQNLPASGLVPCRSISRLTVTGSHYKKKLFGGYISFNATDLKFTGSANVSRSPISTPLGTPNSGYYQSNPFTNLDLATFPVSAVSFTHFYDIGYNYSQGSLPCLYVTHGTYKLTSYLGAIPNGPNTISW